MPLPPRREEVVAMLATFGDRQADQVQESIDSLELAWLVHQIEQRYGRRLDIDDDVLAGMSTVSGVVRLLGDLRFEAAHD